jgi:hypothetical protein
MTESILFRLYLPVAWRSLFLDGRFRVPSLRAHPLSLVTQRLRAGLTKFRRRGRLGSCDSLPQRQ